MAKPAAPSAELVPGDVVTLASGGPPMTVAVTSPTTTHVLWIRADGSLGSADVPTACLKRP